MRPDPEEWQPSALAALGRVSRLLAHPTPESLDACQPLLEQVRIGLRQAAARGGQLPPGVQAQLRADLTEMRKLLWRTHLLLEQAAGFYSGWLRLKNILTGGYTAQGEPVPALAQSRLSLEA
jgi:hypothetical protein